MKAIQFLKNFEIVELETPEPTGHDILVKIEAISVNPVDYKRRKAVEAEAAGGTPRILGWDAAGSVVSVGSKVTRFNPGDRVYYAGDINRPGSNASHQLVDERIVGRCPKTLSLPEAAAMALTGITAWEALFTRLLISKEKDENNNILIIGGAGGVGSMAVQLAKKVAGLTVIATASREETREWCYSLGADYCINHHENMKSQLEAAGYQDIPYILCLNSTDRHFDTIADLIAPQGKICSIVETSEKHALYPKLFSKSVTFVWELMFTRSAYSCDDMHKQHELLCELADLTDSGLIRTTMHSNLGPMSVETLWKAHKQLESGSSIGKTVLEGLT